MPIVNLPSPTQGSNEKETVQNLMDVVFKLRKELDFLLQNLDSTNIDTLVASKVIAGTIDLIGGSVDWNDVSNIPGTLDAPSGQGLFLDSLKMGFYDNGTWKTYMDSNGNFYLGGTSGKLQWIASTNTLTIQGDLVAGTININTDAQIGQKLTLLDPYNNVAAELAAIKVTGTSGIVNSFVLAEEITGTTILTNVTPISRMDAHVDDFWIHGKLNVGDVDLYGQLTCEDLVVTDTADFTNATVTGLTAVWG